ncbi:phytanoyl-CoA dioxygenase family protein [Streptomyces olivoreticuli]
MTSDLAALMSRLAEDGFALVPDALSAEQVAGLLEAVDRAYERNGDQVIDEPAKQRSQLFAVPDLDPEFLAPLTHSTTLAMVCEVMGVNIYVYHSHLDISRPLEPGQQFAYRWHRDMQSTTYSLPEPMPLLSLKAGFFLTDVTTPDHGGPWVVPGSHLKGWMDLPAEPGNEPPDAVPLLAPAGTAVVIDPRVWHAVGANRSVVTRRMIYYAYAYRWIRPYEQMDLSEERLAALSPPQRQLLGAGGSPDGYHLPKDGDLPLKEAVRSGPRPSPSPWQLASRARSAGRPS